MDNDRRQLKEIKYPATNEAVCLLLEEWANFFEVDTASNIFDIGTVLHAWNEGTISHA